jgi:hypothetical protein
MKLCRLFLFVLLISLPCRTAGAERLGKAQEAAMQAARPYAEKGFELYEDGRYAACIAEFERAEARYHAPPHLLYIARAQAQLGRLIEARDGFRGIIDEVLDEGAPKAFHVSQVEAKAEIGELERLIPRVEVTVTGIEADSAQIIVDGEALTDRAESVELDPGEHTIEASSDGASAPAQSVTLAPGDRTQITLEMQLSKSGASLRVPAFVSFGFGGLGLVIGTVTGIVSLGQTADIDDQCVDNHCPSSLESDADDAKAMGNLSTAAFVIAGLAAAAGTTLLLLDNRQESAAVAGLELHLAPGAVQLQASF